MKINKESWEWTDITKLKVDGFNPNRMSDTEKEALKANIARFGFNMPIITDMDYLIADGEQKLTVAKEMGIKEVPVLRKRVTDTERRILRQSMNKISGIMDPLLDAEEFKKILEKHDLQELTNLIGESEQDILNTLNKLQNEDLGKELKVQSVESLGKLQITCPFCKKTFQKESNI